MSTRCLARMAKSKKDGEENQMLRRFTKQRVNKGDRRSTGRREKRRTFSEVTMTLKLRDYVLTAVDNLLCVPDASPITIIYANLHVIPVTFACYETYFYFHSYFAIIKFGLSNHLLR